MKSCYQWKKFESHVPERKKKEKKRDSDGEERKQNSEFEKPNSE